MQQLKKPKSSSCVIYVKRNEHNSCHASVLGYTPSRFITIDCAAGVMKFGGIKQSAGEESVLKMVVLNHGPVKDQSWPTNYKIYNMKGR